MIWMYISHMLEITFMARRDWFYASRKTKNIDMQKSQTQIALCTQIVSSGSLLFCIVKMENKIWNSLRTQSYNYFIQFVAS